VREQVEIFAGNVEGGHVVGVIGDLYPWRLVSGERSKRRDVELEFVLDAVDDQANHVLRADRAQRDGNLGRLDRDGRRESGAEQRRIVVRIRA